ncbi:MAG TPA: STAS domain-containing protein [Chryseosolibacter sp.]
MITETLDIIKKSQSKIVTNWNALQRSENYSSENLMTTYELHQQSTELLTVFVKSLSADPGGAEALDGHITALSMEWAKRGFTPRETIGFVFNLKNSLIQVLQENIRDPQLLYSESLKLEKLMDALGINVFESSIQVHEKQILRQGSELNDISTPIIKMWDGIIALPIIGTLDSSRTQDVMDELLRRIAKDNVHIAIVDISGVPAIDSTVAQHMLKLVTAVRLLGGDCIISGIRPEIAQTMVNLGIEMTHIITKATLADALRIAFLKIQLEVTKKSRVV